MKQKTVALLIGNTRYPVTDKGEGALKRRLYAKYTATTPVEVWVDNQLINICELQDIFTKLNLQSPNEKIQTK